MLRYEHTRSPVAVRLLTVLAWMGVIFALSSRSKLPRPPGLGPDLVGIVGHFTVYAVLAALLWWALPRRDGEPWQRVALAFVGAVAYGVSDEWHQSFVPGRDPALFDLAVDALGAASALAILRLVGTENGRKRRQEEG